MALAPDARVVGVAVKTSIFLFSSSSGELMETLSNVHGGVCLSVVHLPKKSSENPKPFFKVLSPVKIRGILLSTDTITSLVWEPSSLYLASAGGADRHIRLWYNAPGLKELIKELQPKIPKASSEPLKVCSQSVSLLYM